MAISSVKTRFVVSLVTNIAKAGISFITVILIARSLSPAGYGDLFFLLGSFTALRALMDMGTSQAFYTFIAQSSRDRTFYFFYFSWIALQFFVTSIVIAIFIPSSVINDIWLGQSRNAVLLAFLASFMQQQVWNTMLQVCEARRLTVMVQLVSLAISIIHFFIIITLVIGNFLTVDTVLIAIAIEFAIACVAIWFLMRNRQENGSFSQLKKLNFSQILAKYWYFCRPLIAIAIFSFGYEFLDRWMLQRFGGSEQQGYYQVAAQFAAVSLIATTSILRILWKEIAEAYKSGDQERVTRLYIRANRGLLMLGAVISCFLVPWSKELTLLLLGEAYLAGWPILALMFLYPIHQSMGQINATMFMACERTKPYMQLTIIGLLISMPVTYVLLAPPEGLLIAGLGFGAMGLAIKMLVMNVLLVNIQSWFLARYHGWNFEWKYQILGVALLLFFGFLTREITLILFDIGMKVDKLQMLLSMAFSGAAYISSVFVLLWMYPGFFGVEKYELKNIVDTIVTRFRLKTTWQ